MAFPSRRPDPMTMPPVPEHPPESTPLVLKADPGTVEQQRMFANMSFTFFLCLSCPTTVIATWLGTNVDVVYFLGRVGLLGLLLPVFVLSMHLVHVHQILSGRPRLSTLLLVAVVPPIFGIVLGGYHMSSAESLFMRLKSPDCTGARGVTVKVDLQDAWVDAHHVWQKCKKRLVEANDGNAIPSVLLQHCKEWTSIVQSSASSPISQAMRHITTGRLEPAKLLNAHKRFEQLEYLANVESAHHCSGFCTSGPFLWTQQSLLGRNGNTVPCAPAIAVQFRIVKEKGGILATYNALLLIGGLAVFAMVEKNLSKLGYT